MQSLIIKIAKVPLNPKKLSHFISAVNRANSILGKNEIRDILIPDFVFLRFFWLLCAIVHTLSVIAFDETKPMTLSHALLALKIIGYGNLAFGIVSTCVIVGAMILMSEYFPHYFCNHFRRREQIAWLYRKTVKTQKALKQKINEQYQTHHAYPHEMAEIEQELTKIINEMNTLLHKVY